MDAIRQAIDLARASGISTEKALQSGGPLSSGASEAQVRNIRLDPQKLSESRIVSFGDGDKNSRYYDMLRTQIVQEMDKKSWQFLAVTSPTPGCGKTVTACNLAMSIARLAERSAMLVDLDLRKPKVTEYLGIPSGPGEGVLSVLESRASLLSAVVQASVGPNSVMVLPGSHCASGSSEWMASDTMGTLLQSIKREFRSRVVIFDLPPILMGDDVITILPRMDAVLLVTGVGQTSVADIKECQKHLQRTPVVRVVVNKVHEQEQGYSLYY